MTRLARGAMPSLYAILDAEAVAGAGRDLIEVARELRGAGVTLLQYRDKRARAEDVLANAEQIRAIFGESALLLLNDYPELCVRAGWDGVHVGQGDATVEAARRIVGPQCVVGVSTHDATQVRIADATNADYIAIGPVYATASKRDTEAEVGLAGVAAARALTTKPLVAIGGIDASRAGAVLDAGADAVAVIGALLSEAATIAEAVRRFSRPA